jgi:hypothetical protein
LRSVIHTPAGIKALSITRLLYQPQKSDWIDTNQISIPVRSLPSRFEGYRIAQISDFHLGTWMTIDYLLDAVRRVNNLAPDLIVITGDFVTYKAERFMDDLSAAVSKLSANDGILAILGNHDHWTDAALVSDCLKACGVNVLSNQIIQVQRGEATLVVAGLDDVMAGKDDLSLILNALPDGKNAILLAHEPDFADVSSQTSRFSLQLSGHAHGGQIILPRRGALYLPNHGRKYPCGLYKLDGMLLYSNSGLGTAELQFRYNSRPEIAVFTLHSGY